MAEKKILYKKAIMDAFSKAKTAVKESALSFVGETKWEHQKRILNEQRRQFKPTKK